MNNFLNGFIKRAKEHGMSEDQAHQTAQQHGSWLGRWLASRHVPLAQHENHRQVMDDIDPKREIPVDMPLYGENYKKYRHAAYNYVKPSLERAASGSAGRSAGWGALGGGVGGVLLGLKAGLIHGGGGGVGLPMGIGALGGAGLGALSGLANNKFSKWQNNKVTPKDITDMQHQQKDRSLLSEFLPFRNMYDASKAGRE